MTKDVLLATHQGHTVCIPGMQDTFSLCVWAVQGVAGYAAATQTKRVNGPCAWTGQCVYATSCLCVVLAPAAYNEDIGTIYYLCMERVGFHIQPG